MLMVSCFTSATTPTDCSVLSIGGGIGVDDGTSTSDLQPYFCITPVCNSTIATVNLFIDTAAYGTDTGLSSSVQHCIQANASVPYGTYSAYVVISTTGTNVTTSGTIDFTVSRFGTAGTTITAISTSLIGPIANLVIKLIVLFVALFVIQMMKNIFGGVGDAIGRQI